MYTCMYDRWTYVRFLFFCFSDPGPLLLPGHLLLAEHHVLQHLVDLQVGKLTASLEGFLQLTSREF